MSIRFLSNVTYEKYYSTNASLLVTFYILITSIKNVYKTENYFKKDFFHEYFYLAPVTVPDNGNGVLSRGLLFIATVKILNPSEGGKTM